MLRYLLLLLFSFHLFANFDGFVEEKMEMGQLPGVAIGVVSRDGVEMRCYGTRDGEQPVTEETLFAIGSCTKAFTATLLGQLVDEGLIEWDQPVLGFTLRDLLAHRTGLPRHDLVWYGAEISREELRQRLEFLPPPLAPDPHRFSYNNLMYMVAGSVAEDAIGLSWEELIQQRIFDPLGMRNASTSIEEGEEWALPHRDGQPIPFRELTVIAPAGAINASLKDMVPWLQFHLGSGAPLLRTETLQEMQRPQIHLPGHPAEAAPYEVGYGFGWRLCIHRGYYLVTHNGLIDGFRAEVMLLPEKQIGVVVLANGEDPDTPWMLALAALDRQLNIAQEEWQCSCPYCLPEAPPEEEPTALHRPLSDYLGRYFHPAYGDLQIELEEDQLIIQFHGMSLPMECICQFHAEPSGSIGSLDIPFEPLCKPIRFTRCP